MLNYDKIRRLDLKEMAKFLFAHGGNCDRCLCQKECEEARADVTCDVLLEKWLRKEAEDD